jgi:hypothetical protein
MDMTCSENIEKTGKSERYAIVARMPLLLRSQQDASQPPHPAMLSGVSAFSILIGLDGHELSFARLLLPIQ